MVSTGHRTALGMIQMIGEVAGGFDVDVGAAGYDLGQMEGREPAGMIASPIGRSAPSLSREIARNGGREHYRAAVADAATWKLSRRPKTSKLDLHEGSVKWCG